MNDYRTASAVAATALHGFGKSIQESLSETTSEVGLSNPFQLAVENYFSRLNPSSEVPEKPFLPVAPEVMISTLAHLPRL